MEHYRNVACCILHHVDSCCIMCLSCLRNPSVVDLDTSAFVKQETLAICRSDPDISWVSLFVGSQKPDQVRMNQLDDAWVKQRLQRFDGSQCLFTVIVFRETACRTTAGVDTLNLG